jgi:hypothetical protein
VLYYLMILRLCTLFLYLQIVLVDIAIQFQSYFKLFG